MILFILYLQDSVELFIFASYNLSPECHAEKFLLFSTTAFLCI